MLSEQVPHNAKPTIKELCNEPTPNIWPVSGTIFTQIKKVVLPLCPLRTFCVSFFIVWLYTFTHTSAERIQPLTISIRR